MKSKYGIAILGISFLVLLGIFVNPIFLYFGIFLLCPLMHLLGGHASHGIGSEHKDHRSKQEKDKNEVEEGQRRCH